MSQDYEIGYGKPPKRTQFKQGQSGNPKGRSKGVKNLATDLREEMSEKIKIREGDVVKKISKQRAIIKALQVKALKGDTRAIATIFDLHMKLLAHQEQRESARINSDEDETIIQQFLNRNKGKDDESTND